MTEHEEKPSAAPVAPAAAEDEILLDSPIGESEEKPGAEDAPGLVGSEEAASAPAEPAGRADPENGPGADEALPAREEVAPPSAASVPEAGFPEGASSSWPREEAALPVSGGGEPPAPVDPGEAPAPDEEPEERPMTLLEHLGELRKRLARGFLAILIGFFACYGFAKELFYYLSLPLLKVMPADAKFIYTGVAEGFFVDLKVSFVAGVFVACPFLFYQIWAFIAPGLYDEEKRYVVPLALASALFFLGGGLFCYFVVFPFAFEFFMSYSTDNIVAMLSIGEYLSFALKMLIAFGLIFEMPLFSFFLSRMGIISAQWMRNVRKYAVLAVFVVAAILTPPDVFSQLLMAAPMLVLYEISIWVAALVGKKKKAKNGTPEPAREGEA